ncbi:hypothetical protein ACN42_g2048 [Penicillium freii]|uniref:Uncharacterized protein n=1 Tax=Penicillium freii TaxID=48697 RepID=A0A124GSP0_PENFR|nr:hypothetical protein ACN42_g2048 [Penicillium freii]
MKDEMFSIRSYQPEAGAKVGSRSFLAMPSFLLLPSASLSPPFLSSSQLLIIYHPLCCFATTRCADISSFLNHHPLDTAQCARVFNFISSDRKGKDDSFIETFQGYAKLTKTGAKMSTLADNFSSHEGLIIKARQTDMPNMSDNSVSIDRKCFSTLPEDTLVVDGSSFRSIRKINKIIKEQTELGIDVAQYLCFNDISPELVEQFSSKSARLMYCHDTQSMIIKLVGGPHEAAARRIDSILTAQCFTMGLFESLRPTGGIRLSGVSSAKEADGSFIPTPPIPGRGQWPTIVVEVAVSESYKKLRADAAWWFSNSKGAVKVVIIVAVSKKKEEEKKEKMRMITFETIILDSTTVSLRPLSHRRRSYKTITRQKITTSKPGLSDRRTPITAHPDESLLIKFEEAFDRPAIPPEHDFLLTPDLLRTASREVWEAQDLDSAEKSAQSKT